MRIAGLVGKDSGPGFHRITMPLLMMPGIDCHITNNVTDETLEAGCDVVYYNRHVDDHLVEKFRKAGAKIVVDVDDYWYLDQHHIAYKQYRDYNFPAIQVKHLQGADVVTTTHDRLAERIYQHNKNVIVTPNAIPKHEYFTVEKTQSGRVRIFWQGSITHEQDLLQLAWSIKGLYHDAAMRDQVMMVLAGYTEHHAWNSMVDTFTNHLKLKGVVLPGEPPAGYYKNYQYADIALAPLLASEFNSLKSNLKILEAANVGVPVIASAVDPYLNIPHVLYAGDKKDWLKLIRQLVNEPAMRNYLGRSLKEYCEAEYNFDKINMVRKAAML